MIKVYGFHRSGNNFLIQTIIKNFIFNEDIKRVIKNKQEFIRFKKTFYLDEEVKGDYVPHLIKNNNGVWVHPYGKLFGGHHKSPFDTEGIYIIRNPRDVMLSLWKLKSPGIPFNKWCDTSRLKGWKNHISHYKKENFFIIKYEDLRDKPMETLKKIHHHYNLTPKYEEYVTLDKLVGWSPPTGKLEGISRTSSDFSEVVNKRFEPFVKFYENVL